jgi:hypothetical protein
MLGLLLVAVLALAGCNHLAGQPQFRAAAVTPPILAPDSSGIITVKVDDPHGIVARVEGVVRENEDIRLPFRDDGQGEDETAGDGVWSIRVDVPFETPPGEFALVVTAYRDDGQPILVRQKDAGAVPMATTLPVVIRYPEESAATGTAK